MTTSQAMKLAHRQAQAIAYKTVHDRYISGIPVAQIAEELEVTTPYVYLMLNAAPGYDKKASKARHEWAKQGRKMGFITDEE